MKTMINLNNVDGSFISSKLSDFQPRLLNYYQLAISSSDDDKLVFEEKLALVDASGQKLDDVVVAVEKDEDGAFMVYQYSQDESRLLRLQSRVYRSLETDTELRRIQMQDQTKMLRVTVFEDQYRVFLMCVKGKDGWRDKVEYIRSLDDLLILEGSNVVLLRMLAINNVFGQFKGQTINHDGELCVCEYNVERGENCEVIVRREVTSEEGQEVMTTVMNREGQILLHQWSSSGWCMLSDKPRNKAVTKTKSASDVDSASFQPEVKADQGAYFEKKEELIQQMTLFLRDQSDVGDMIADFLKNLFFEKPDDVLGFADQFLSEFVGMESLSEESGSSGRTMST